MGLLFFLIVTEIMIVKAKKSIYDGIFRKITTSETLI
jgi:hypothetical protein